MSASKNPVSVAKELPATMILEDDKIIETVDQLQRRIKDRFPDSGLAKLCGQLLNVARQAAQRSAWIERPTLWIRAVGLFLALGMVLILVALGITAFNSGVEDENLTFVDFVQTFESGVNEAIFIGVAIFFLIGLETRIKRRRALEAVHELRAISHIIDMHQLTKDPERVLGNWQATENSPKTSMTPQELNRYLDYCSEMLSLTGKIAALYVRKFDDPVAVAAVSEVEHLSTGLSRKIWQKIIILRPVTESVQPRASSAEPTREQAGDAKAMTS
jgi:hypothetical protein